MKRRTLRGLLPDGEIRKLIVDDGNFNQGYKVLEFHVFTTSLTGSRDVNCVLGLDSDMKQVFDASDNRQIGWASQQNNIGAQEGLGNFSLVDPDHIVLRDLYVANFSPAGGYANYLIIVEPVELTDDQAVLTLIKERSQDDWN
jgi:hypothetical protein